MISWFGAGLAATLMLPTFKFRKVVADVVPALVPSAELEHRTSSTCTVMRPPRTLAPSTTDRDVEFGFGWSEAEVVFAAVLELAMPGRFTLVPSLLLPPVEGRRRRWSRWVPR
jgi:hypothetical protein